MQEAYENLGKWGRGDATRLYVLGSDGHPVDSTGKPIKVQSEAPGVGLYGPDGKPLLDTNGKPYKKPNEPGVGLYGPDGKPLLDTNGKPYQKPNEPGVGLYGPDGKPLLDTNGNSISDKTRNARQDDDLIPTLVAGIVAGQDKSDIAHTPEVVTQTPRTDSRSTGAQMAERLGYPEPPEGYHWARHGDDVILKRNPGMAESLPRLEYDPASGKFVQVEPRATSAGAQEVQFERTFALGKLHSHYEKHGAEFGYKTQSEYLRGAQRLTAGGKEIQTFVRVHGDTLFYNPSTNEFAVLSKENI